MGKKFNVTGACIPENHYMVDINGKIEKIIKLIKEGEYFVINKPRQYGKTTMLYMLERTLSKNSDYEVISISFEDMGDLIFEEEQRFAKSFLNLIEKSLLLSNEELAEFIEKQKSQTETIDDLSCVITKLIKKADKKVVLMIDEVDKNMNSQCFLSFLGMLRSKYLFSNEGFDYTFCSVILAGVHDVKSFNYNSPWNIASDFNVDMSFSKEEISTMLDDYMKNTGIGIDKEYFSERLYFYTSGYPFLVSKLCKIIDEKLLKEGEKSWNKEYMDLSVKELLKESNTNFDSLIKNLENNHALYVIINNLLINGIKIDYNQYNPDINLGILYGIFKNDNGKLKIHNRIYEQLIYDYMASKIQTSLSFTNYNNRTSFTRDDGTLDVKDILLKFQEFMKHEYSEKRKTFLEEDGRLIFLAFLSPIINGSGFAFKEVQGGEEKRFDIVITYEKQMFIIELKIWYGEEYHKKGEIQLGEYLNQYNLDEGYLLIFDFRKDSNSRGKMEEKHIKAGEKEKKLIEFYS